MRGREAIRLFGRRLRRLSPLPVAGASAGVALLAVLAFIIAPMLGTASPPSGAVAPPVVGDSEAALLDLRGVLDSDLDGVGDALENYAYGSDPLAWSSNGDPIPDGWYARYGYDPVEPQLSLRPAATPPFDVLPPAYANEWPSRFTPTLWEVYAHGRPAEWNESEQGPFASGLNPTQWDQDGDGIADGFLLAFGLDPLEEGMGPRRLAGTEGLTVLEAFQHRTDPRALDSDGDGLKDREELDGPRNPVPGGPARFPPTDPSRASTSGSGVCDGYLVVHGLDPTVSANGYGDPDGDGATTQEEYKWSREHVGPKVCKEGGGADPTVWSTGGLPIPDGWLIRYGLDLLDPDTPSKSTQDSSTDPGPDLGGTAPHIFLTVLDEYNVGRPPTWDEATVGPWWGGTDPTKIDSDGDGLGDAWELRGYDVSVNAVPTQPDAITYTTGSDPTKADSDNDGLTDGEEADPSLGPATVTDARRRDTDFDGIPDGTEVLGTLDLNPVRADSAGDLLRDGVRLRFLEEHASAYQLDLAYEHPGETGVARSVADWIVKMEGAKDLSKPPSKDAVSALVGPTGDLDGDGIKNILDDDMDDDGIRNGFELTPALYEQSEFGAGRLATGRPASDPLNPDTDGDGLPDGWEVRYGIEDHTLGRYNLDPSRWDSDDDGEGDADEDPDGDSITWYTYGKSGDLYERQEQRYMHSNHQEYEHNTHPNQPSGSDDGLLDGWRVFWSAIYPTLGPTTAPSTGDLYPGSADGFLSLPVLDVRLDDGEADDVLVTLPYLRHVIRTADLLPWESAKNGLQVPGPNGNRAVYPVEGEFPLTLLTAQETGINPYMALLPASSDGDGMSDAWEILHQGVLPGTKDTAGNEQAGCVDGVPGPDPTQHDAGGDLDGDALSNGDEHEHGADPLCQDSDLGLLLDGQEVSETLETPLDPADPKDDKQLLDSQEDSDGDGMFDFEELTGTGRMRDLYSTLGLVRTDPLNPDTDRDGLLDGVTYPDPDDAGLPLEDPLTQRFLDLGIAYYTEGPLDNRRFHFLGEADAGTDPRNGDDTGTGVPAGWLAAYSIGLGAASSYTNQYELAMPTWWDGATHGVWWGGASPLLYPTPQSMESLQNDVDLDRDGLRDRDDQGNPFEDPMPGANRPNSLRAVDFQAHDIEDPGTSDPSDEDLDPLLARLLGQSYLNPRTVGSKALSRPGPGEFEAPSRQSPCIVDAGLVGDKTILKGTPKVIQGTVQECSGDGTGIPGLVVEARMGTGSNTQVFGLGVTAADGSFAVPIDITSTHATQIPDTVVALGQQGGDVAWITSPAAISPGSGHAIRLRTYAAAAPDDVESGFTRSEQVLLQQITVRAASAVSIPGLPDTAPSGSDLTLRVVLADSTGTPLRDPVLVRLGNHAEETVFPDENGAAGLTFAIPHSLTGDVTLTARSIPGSTHVDAGSAEEHVRFLQPSTLRLSDLPDTRNAGDVLRVQGQLSTAAGNVPGSAIDVVLGLAGEAVHTAITTTGPDGTFQTDLHLASTLAGGTYVVQATASDTARTSGTQSTQELVIVRGLPRFAAVSTEPLDAEQTTFNVTGLLLEPDGNPIADATIQAALGTAQGNAVTDENGAFRARIQATLPPIPILQSLLYEGDLTHAPARLDVERSVHAKTTLSIPAGILARGAVAQTELILNDTNGAGIPGVAVAVTWGDEAPRTVITDETGHAIFQRPGDPADKLGPVVLRATFDGSSDGTLAPSQTSAIWIVEAQARLVLPSGQYDLGSEMPLGLLQDAGTGTPIVRSDVHMQWNRTFQDESLLNRTADTRTDDEGRFDALPDTARDEQPSRIILNASHDGGAVYGLVEATSTVTLRSPTLLTTQAPDRAVADRTLLVLIHVTDGQGLPVTGGLVNATLQNQQVGQAPVVDGVARVPVTLPAKTPAGPNSLRFLFDGTDTHGTSTVDQTIRVVAPGTLALRIHAAPTGGVTVVEAIATVGDQVLPFTPVRIQVEGMPSGIEAITDENGVARFEILQSNATMLMAVSIAGDDGHSPATVHGVLAPATPAGPSSGILKAVAWTAAALAVVLVAAALVARRLRRHELAPALRRARLALDGRGPFEEQILKAYQILEDAAIAHEILDEPAMTPRLLEEAIQTTVAPSLHPSLHRLISFFEVARYGTTPLVEGHRDQAVQALDDLRAQLSKMDPFWQESAATPEATA